MTTASTSTLSLTRVLAAVCTVSVLIFAGGLLQAQPTDPSATPEDLPDVSLEMTKQAQISPEDMRIESERLITEMKGHLERVIAVQQLARKQKDIIRLNCVNDRLLQVKKLLNIAEAARNDMVEAIATRNERDRSHQFNKVRIASEQVASLRIEAEACVGESILFTGEESGVEVEGPPIVDDPTKEDPFVITGERVERPAYASPFL